MIHYQHDWYNLFPKSHHTESIELIDLAVPFLAYAHDRDRSKFYNNFLTCYWRNISPELSEILDNLYNAFSCDCDNCLYEKLGSDPDQGAYDVILASVKQIIALIDLNSYDQRSMQASVCDEFKEDYQTILATLLSGALNLQQAEKSLLYWNGLVPDALMQDGLLYMRYKYLMQMLVKH